MVRELTNLGLKEAKDLVDAAPKAVLEQGQQGRRRQGQGQARRGRRHRRAEVAAEPPTRWRGSARAHDRRSTLPGRGPVVRAADRVLDVAARVTYPSPAASPRRPRFRRACCIRVVARGIIHGCRASPAPALPLEALASARPGTPFAPDRGVAVVRLDRPPASATRSPTSSSPSSCPISSPSSGRASSGS